MLYQIAVLRHLLAAITWVGGAIFLAAVMVPVSRQGALSPPQSAELIGSVARRFRPMSWASISVAVLTGLYIATDRWGVEMSDVFGGSGWFLRGLQAKGGLVVAVIVLSLIHDFIIGPRVSALMEAGHGGADPEVRRARRSLILLARINMVLILLIVALAVTITRGSPF